jgi:hypothetical protein
MTATVIDACVSLGFLWILIKVLRKTKLKLLGLISVLIIMNQIFFVAVLWIDYRSGIYKRKVTKLRTVLGNVLYSLAYSCYGVAMWLFVSRYWATSIRMKN